ncbi:small ribosomal subunit Rsm22 family protein [Streptomyces sp. B1866]|uniref:small ribosomal subunit Rsm22 family protein n=1 Tax=Streptomyces sp. B1866 TaxID=3075431 RepID=UPI002890D5BB|nr:small ribosomal subunit Rsm22 family protein [Streptomyces sp. B1866]MDT3398701.1 small ribosomal subunit Rsm22 family protein [Streptomyces sp. B1866]
MSTGESLRAALDRLLEGVPPRQAARAVERLMASYRGPTPTGAPVLRDRADAAAYAAYRMPATYEAVGAALAALRAAVPDWAPASHVDLGGGTGAAGWAVAAAWPEGERATTVLDWAEPALALGRELARDAACQALRGARWQRQALAAGPALPEGTDLVTVSYVLGELDAGGRRAVVDAAARAQVVVLVEPGTPEGYLRVREARERLVAAGLRVVAPCPHSDACPVVPGADWCHFAARVARSSLHRRVKGGSLPYEDEKFSYVVAARWQAPAAAGRVVRRPRIAKGQVLLELCTPDGLRRETVTKRLGPVYRAARDTGWGDAWPP